MYLLKVVIGVVVFLASFHDDHLTLYVYMNRPSKRVHTNPSGPGSNFTPPKNHLCVIRKVNLSYGLEAFAFVIACAFILIIFWSEFYVVARNMQP